MLHSHRKALVIQSTKSAFLSAINFCQFKQYNNASNNKKTLFSQPKLKFILHSNTNTHTYTHICIYVYVWKCIHAYLIHTPMVVCNFEYVCIEFMEFTTFGTCILQQVYFITNNGPPKNLRLQPKFYSIY